MEPVGPAYGAGAGAPVQNRLALRANLELLAPVNYLPRAFLPLREMPGYLTGCHCDTLDRARRAGVQSTGARSRAPVRMCRRAVLSLRLAAAFADP